MKIVIINCHWDNRGDEAAIRAMIDELRVKYPSADIYRGLWANLEVSRKTSM